MKYFILFLAIICIFTTSYSTEKEDIEPAVLSGLARMEFGSQSLSNGFDISNNKPVHRPLIFFDLFQTGFELLSWGSFPIDRSMKINDLIEFSFRYTEDKLTGQAFQFNFHGFICYSFAPNNHQYSYTPYPDSEDPFAPWIEPLGLKQLWKLNMGISFEKLIPLSNSYLVPSIDMYNIMPAGDAFFTKGCVFNFGLKYDNSINDKLDYGFNFIAIYFDKVRNYHTWGAFVFTNNWNYKVNKTLALQARLNYQVSPDSRINTDNEFWMNAGIEVSF